MVTMRVDESLYFANARFLEDNFQGKVAGEKAIRHVILQCSASNEIDLNTLKFLEATNESTSCPRLQEKSSFRSLKLQAIS